MVILVKLRVECINKHPTKKDGIFRSTFNEKAIQGNNLRIQLQLAKKKKRSNLENITNSTKDLVGKTQLCMTDHVPSTGMGGRELKFCFNPYIFLRASEKANLQYVKHH